MGWLAPDHEAIADCPPMPADFAPPLLHDQKTVRWRGRVEGGAQLEVGFRKSAGDAEEKTRLAVWHLQHLARQGRHEHLANARADRHGRRPRPASPPALPPAPPRSVEVPA